MFQLSEKNVSAVKHFHGSHIIVVAVRVGNFLYKKTTLFLEERRFFLCMGAS